MCIRDSPPAWVSTRGAVGGQLLQMGPEVDQASLLSQLPTSCISQVLLRQNEATGQCPLTLERGDSTTDGQRGEGVLPHRQDREVHGHRSQRNVCLHGGRA